MDSPSEPPVPLKNIVLVGFMGCGKSVIGRRLSERLNYPLFDTDHLIEERENAEIKTIFAEKGEPYFRNCESEILRSLVANAENEQIIATGGGIVTTSHNIPILRDLGFVVWLDARVETVLERVARNTDRPLLNCDDPEARVRELRDQRRPFYESASHLKLDTDGLDCAEIATGIIESARYYFGTHE